MYKQPKIVFIAGEESGDCHAAAIIRQLKESHPGLQISGIGGKHMQQEGADLLYNLAQFGVTGLTEILKHFTSIRRAFLGIKEHLKQHKPDLLVLIDYPGFNLRIAKYAKKVLGIKILYYISPQIWAWKANRIHLIKECVDRMAVILPFEKAIYEKAQVPVTFVGHPLVNKLSVPIDLKSCRMKLFLPNDVPLMALLPGSRLNEIERHMPVLCETAKLLSQANPDMHFVIPVAQSQHHKHIQSYLTGLNLPISLVEEKAVECMAAADFVIVASGTASLECALLGKPMCIIYKSSFLTYFLALKLIKVKFLGLCNLLANTMIIPEFLQYDCNAKELALYIIHLHRDNYRLQHMMAQLALIKKSLSIEKSDCSIVELIEKELPQINA